ncbi:hypothetical protein [Streptomyces sp. NPDC048737]|uniref:hypothetical protein n=1 Tax=unclassified Streptomyces TaxID=2593676 RepID=UPI003416009A
MSKANDAEANNAKENSMSFHKVAPVKKTRKAAPAPKKKAAEKTAPKRRPVAHKG